MRYKVNYTRAPIHDAFAAFAVRSDAKRFVQALEDSGEDTSLLRIIDTEEGK